MSAPLAAFALMFGNFVIGVAILAPAGMLGELAQGLAVTIRDAGMLVTFGAVVLCVGSPLVTWATSRVARRTLLSATVAVVALGHAASAFAPNYGTLLALRLVMVAVAAIYTPQAASTIALIVPARRGRAPSPSSSSAGRWRSPPAFRWSPFWPRISAGAPPMACWPRSRF
jgi:MFS transporter, DHA1 family, inner membrane transport protein